MSVLYRTVRARTRVEQTIERSRFIATIAPVESREEADSFLASIRAEFRDATHNVPAMVIGQKGELEWASDDGEPQGTSGPPVLKLLVSRGLTNVVIVITRYFGGIKLGTGGLVRAYSGTAQMALEAAGITEVCDVASFTCTCDYASYSRIQSKLPEDALMSGQSYAADVRFRIDCLPEREEQILALLKDLSGGSIRITDRQVEQKPFG